MSKHYELRRDESLADAFRRIADAQLERARDALTDSKLAPEKQIHDARKRLKETRALARLYAGCSGSDFSFQNLWYRDQGRILAGYRDAAATVEALRSLPRAVRAEIGRYAMRRLSRFVGQRRDALYGDEEGLARTVDLVVSAVEPMRIQVRTLSLAGCNAEAIEEGLATTLRRGRRAMHEAYESGMESAFHEWRKRVKDHWYHVQLFLPVWPELLAIREEALDELSHLLGAHHDLSVVRCAASELPRVRAGTLGRINRVLTERQREIAAAARPIAERLYAPKPRALAGEVVSLWRTWHDGAPGSQPA